MKCELHPKYKGKTKPSNITQDGCTCAGIWLKMQKPRTGIQHTTVVPDKTKYSRKKLDKPTEET